MKRAFTHLHRHGHVRCFAVGGQVRETLSYYRHPVTGVDLYLVGTAHVSAKSAEEVRDVIRTVRPKTVMVELCEKRRKQLETKGETDVLGNRLAMVSGGWGSFIRGAYGSYLRSFARHLGIEAGAEFRVAIDEAKALNAILVLGDRPVDQTLERVIQAGREVGIQRILSFMSSSTSMKPPVVPTSTSSDDPAQALKDSVEAMKSRKYWRERLHEMDSRLPAIAQALIHERDEYMVRELLKAPGETIVAVVGFGHMEGIERLWKDVSAYNRIKPRS